MKKITIPLENGFDEKMLMARLTCIIEGDIYRDQFPHQEQDHIGWQLDSKNDWHAKLTRKGKPLRFGEQPVQCDTLEVWHRYWEDAVTSLKPWLEYLLSPKTKE